MGDETNGATGADGPKAQGSLDLDMHPDDAVWMCQLGHLKDWCPDTVQAIIAVSTRVHSSVLKGMQVVILLHTVEGLHDCSWPSWARVLPINLELACYQSSLLRQLGLPISMVKTVDAVVWGATVIAALAYHP